MWNRSTPFPWATPHGGRAASAGPGAPSGAPRAAGANRRRGHTAPVTAHPGAVHLNHRGRVISFTKSSCNQGADPDLKG
eukprot:2993176-Prymnesium_polylepis.2